MLSTYPYQSTFAVVQRLVSKMACTRSDSTLGAICYV